MPSTYTVIEISEPQMQGSVWTLAAFRWRWERRWTHQEIERESDMVGWSYAVLMAKQQCQNEFNAWRDSMPEVFSWEYPLVFDAITHRLDDNSRSLKGYATGWFELSDDEEKTANMLDAVTDGVLPDKIMYFMPQTSASMIYGGEVSYEAWERVMHYGSLLEPGTPDNNINPRVYTSQRETRRTVDWSVVDDVRDWYPRINESAGVLRAMLDEAQERVMPDPPAVIVMGGPLPHDAVDLYTPMEGCMSTTEYPEPTQGEPIGTGGGAPVEEPVVGTIGGEPPVDPGEAPAARVITGIYTDDLDLSGWIKGYVAYYPDDVLERMHRGAMCSSSAVSADLAKLYWREIERRGLMRSQRIVED